MDHFAHNPDAATVAVWNQRRNQAQQAGFKMHNEWAELIRSSMEDAGITNQEHIRNAQDSLTKMSNATCLIKHDSGVDSGTGSGMLMSNDELGFWVITCNHCIPDEGTAERTRAVFDYHMTDGNICNLRSFPVQWTTGTSPPWQSEPPGSEQEMDEKHLDFTMLKLIVDRDQDKIFLSKIAMGRSFLMNTVDSLFPVESNILEAMNNGPRYIPLFMFSHPLGLAKRLCTGRLNRVVHRTEDSIDTHYRLHLPGLLGSSGGNILFCPLTQPTYEHWSSVAMFNAGRPPWTDSMAVAWKAILR